MWLEKTQAKGLKQELDARKASAEGAEPCDENPKKNSQTGNQNFKGYPEDHWLFREVIGSRTTT